MIFAHLSSSLTTITALLLVSSKLCISHFAKDSDTPTGLTLTQWNQLRLSEAISDFMGNDAFFSDAMDHEWMNVILDVDRNEDLYCTYIICNQEEGLSGSARINETNAVMFEGKKAWFFPFYNQEDIVCLVAYMNGQDVLSSYSNLTSSERDDFRIQPMSQSMKMVNGTVDKILEQMEQNPGVAIRAFLSPGLMQHGNFQKVEDAGKAILSYLKENALDSEDRSFFYQNRQNVNATSRTEFWSKFLQDGFLTGDNCKYMMDKMTIAPVSSSPSNGINIVEYGIGDLALKPVSERDQACVWSILQGLSFHPAITSLEPKYENVPLPPTSAGCPSVPRFGLGVISALIMLQYFAQCI